MAENLRQRVAEKRARVDDGPPVGSEAEAEYDAHEAAEMAEQHDYDPERGEDAGEPGVADEPVPHVITPHVITTYSPEAIRAVTVPDPHDVPVQVAVARVMAEVRGVGKHDRNQAQNFNFRGIDAVMNAVGPALRNHGVIVMPSLLDATYRDVQTSTGKPTREITVRVKYTFVGPKGDFLTTTVPGEAMDSGDKGTAKAMSVAMRIALLQALCLPTDEPDPDHSVYERAPEPEHPADAARRALLAAAKEEQLDWVAVRKCFRDRYGDPLAAHGDAGEIRAFTSELMANHAEWLAPYLAPQNPPQGQTNTQAAQNGAAATNGAPK